MFTPHSGGAAGSEHDDDVGADEVHDLKKKDGVVQEGVELKPAMQDLAGECSKTCCVTGKAADQDNAALNECKMQEQPSEIAVLAKVLLPSN
nr:unnamed protein product [Digitaria exilis]